MCEAFLLKNGTCEYGHVQPLSEIALYNLIKLLWSNIWKEKKNYESITIYVYSLTRHVQLRRIVLRRHIHSPACSLVLAQENKDNPLGDDLESWRK